MCPLESHLTLSGKQETTRLELPPSSCSRAKPRELLTSDRPLPVRNPNIPPTSFQATILTSHTIAGVKNSAGKYTWNVPGDVPSFPLYGFKISQEDDKSTPAKDESKDADGKEIFQYSFPFHITGSASGSSSSSGAAAGGSYATTVVELGTGPAYTPTPIPTPSANTTVTLVTSTKSATASHSTPKPSSNFTITTPVTTARPTATGTDSPPAQQTGNSAVSNAAASGGLLAVVGGLLMAFAL